MSEPGSISRRAVLAAPVALYAATGEALGAALAAWALEDAAAEEQAGRIELARAIRRDAASTPTPTPRPAPPGYFPPIEDAAANPWFAAAMKRAGTLAGSAARYSKGPAGNIERDRTGWRFQNICNEALDLTRALCHPQSTLAGDARLVAPLLRRFATVYEYLTPGAKNLADFGISPQLGEMYLLLRSVYPGLLLPVYKAAWEQAIDVNAAAIAAQYGAVFEAAKPGTGYPNAHSHYINALLFASFILNRPRYRDLAGSGVGLMESCLYPDGGFCYIGWQNECFTYHAVAVRDMERFAQMTGSKPARSLVERSRWYYPLSVERRGVAEYSTSPCWKPYWNTVSGGDGAAVVAAVTGCPHNARVARENAPVADLWIAGFHRRSLAPAPAPDGYITYDRNIEGARGRFGGYSFSATARDYRDEERGKQTYVGCVALDAGSSASWPLSAALHAAGAEVRHKAGEGGPNRWDTHLCLARQERNRCSVTAGYAALASVHRLSRYKGPATGWECRQEWLLTPRRLVGLIELEALTSQRALSMGAALQFVSGRGPWGVRKEFRRIDQRTWQYGALFVRVHEQDFGQAAIEYTDVVSGDAKKSGRIVLSDSAGERREYVAGTRRHALVEIYPESSAPAAAVECRDGHVLLRDGELTLDSAQVARAERYRAPWLPE